MLVDNGASIRIRTFTSPGKKEVQSTIWQHSTVESSHDIDSVDLVLVQTPIYVRFLVMSSQAERKWSFLLA